MPITRWKESKVVNTIQRAKNKEIVVEVIIEATIVVVTIANVVTKITSSLLR